MLKINKVEEVEIFSYLYKKENGAERTFAYILERECKKRGFSILKRNNKGGKNGEETNEEAFKEKA